MKFKIGDKVMVISIDGTPIGDVWAITEDVNGKVWYWVDLGKLSRENRFLPSRFSESELKVMA